MNKEVIKVKGLKKYFHNKYGVVKAIDDVNLTVSQGEVLGLIGESGSGKTTVGRSLIRLYDNVNGQVILEDQIISGKKINRKRNKFLRKNMQMIFQDPHASLNGQKNVYSILKEPLKVNGIIREKIGDLFSDLKEIQQNFKYTFIKKYEEQKLANLNVLIEEANKYFSDWDIRFAEINFEEMLENNSYEDIFNSYFAYLTKRQFHESKAINQIHKGSANLYSFYFEKQKEYRDGNIDFDEKALRDSRANVKFWEKAAKKSSKKLLLLENLELKEKELKNFKELNKDNFKNSKNYINSYKYEFKSEFELNYNNAKTTNDFNEYSYFLKKSYLTKLAYRFLTGKYQVFKYSKDLLSWLSIEEIDLMIKRINAYATVVANKFNDVIIKKTLLEKTEWKRILEEEFYSNKTLFNLMEKDFIQLNLNEFLDKANNNKNDFYTEKGRKEREIKELKRKTKVKKDPSKEDFKKLELAKKEFAKDQKLFDEELVKFKENFQVWERKISQEIAEKENEFKSIHEKQKVLDALFEAKHKQFISWLSSKVEGNKKEIKELVNSFDQKVKEKNSTLKTFSTEVKLLEKIYSKISYLLGIKATKRPFVLKSIIKNVMIDEIIYSSLEEVGLLRQFAYRYPHEFSGGQRQRIVIARALVTEPKLIIADEPIASLDISIQAQIVNLLKDLADRKGIAMIFIAHDLSMVEYIADNVLIMHLGKIVERGTTEEIYKNPVHPYTINLFESVPKMSNANEPFKASSFELEYLDEQRFPNIAIEQKINGTHFVYGTENQVKRWVKENARKK